MLIFLPCIKRETKAYLYHILQARGRALCMHAYLPVHCVDCWKALWVYMHSDECIFVDAHVLDCPLWVTHFTLQTQ